MDRVKQFLRVRPLLERRPSTDKSVSRPVAAPPPSSMPSMPSPTPLPSPSPSAEGSSAHSTSASSDASTNEKWFGVRDGRRDLLLMLLLLRNFGRRK